MQPNNKRRRYKYWIIYGFSFIVFVLVFIAVVAERFVEPVLKARIHTLIIEGSDSLYNYHLGDLDASFLGANVEVKDLQINVDSIQYKKLEAANDLPSITMQLNMERGYIKGVAIFTLLFSKRISIDEIMTSDANVRLIRTLNSNLKEKNLHTPLWKSIQPGIKSIAINTINLDGIKLLYRYADTSSSVKLQFDTCNAVFKDILIDSVAAFDTARIGFTKDISLRFSDLKFRTPDSMSKMKAEVISYSSKKKTFELVNFKIQPTREEKNDFYGYVNKQKAMEVIEFEKATFTNFQLDRFVNNNIIAADSIIIEKPDVKIFLDKSYPPLLESKIGTYPHQRLLGTDATVIIKGMEVKNASIEYIEKAEKTKQEGTVKFRNLNLYISNPTNDSFSISNNNKCIAKAEGLILNNSPIKASFVFYLDSANGAFDVSGSISDVGSEALNELAVPLANVQFKTFNLSRLDFALHGDDYKTKANVRMLYNDLFIVIQKKNEETGLMENKKFLTKIINKYTLHSSNPSPGQQERTAKEVIRLRISSHGFFGLIWKTIFSGMQNIMIRQGQYE